MLGPAHPEPITHSTHEWELFTNLGRGPSLHMEIHEQDIPCLELAPCEMLLRGFWRVRVPRPISCFGSYSVQLAVIRAM